MHTNLVKFGRVVFEFGEQTNKPTDRRILITILRIPSGGEVTIGGIGLHSFLLARHATCMQHAIACMPPMHATSLFTFYGELAPRVLSNRLYYAITPKTADNYIGNGYLYPLLTSTKLPLLQQQSVMHSQ